MRLAAAVDRPSPVLLNQANQGLTWRSNGIAAGHVRSVNSVVGDAAPQLGTVVGSVIDQAVAGSWIREA